VRDKNREISPLQREEGYGGKDLEKRCFTTRMEDTVRHTNHRFRSRVGAWQWRRALWGGRLSRNAKRWTKFYQHQFHQPVLSRCLTSTASSSHSRPVWRLLYFSTGQRSYPQGAWDRAAVNFWNLRLHRSSPVTSQW